MSDEAAEVPDAEIGADPPRLLVFDVNETLSDLSPMGRHFADVGLPEEAASTWFAALLRDGFALTAAGDKPDFAVLARDSLKNLLGDHPDAEQAVTQVMDGFTGLPVHGDVVEGVRALRQLDITLVTLSNGSTTVAQGLLERNDIADCFERLLSVDDAQEWKPARASYAYALSQMGVDAGEAMLVAVHPWDVHGARKAGLAAAWVNRSDREYPSYFLEPNLEVSSIVDLAAQLGGAGG